MAKDSVVIATLFLARRSKPSKIEVYRIKRERRMKDSQKKRITRNYHLLRRFESWKCCLVTAFICPNCRGIQTNTSNISLKKTIFLSPDIVKWNSFMFLLLMMMNSASASLQVLWMWAACISLHTFQRPLRLSSCRGQRTWRKVTKLESNAMLGWTLVGTQYRK